MTTTRRNDTASGGLGSILLIVQVVFLILKLTGAITWAWPLVLIPLWIILGGALLGLLIAVPLAIFARRRF